MELIKIEDRDGIQTVNARELWTELGSKRQFGNWIQERLEDFTDGVDFIINKFVKVQIEGDREVKRPITEYYLTIDTAKHLSMLERNEQGRKIRQYFIDVENKARQLSAPLTGHALINAALIESNRLLIEAERKNAVLMHVKKLYTATEIAKECGMKSATELNKYLEAKKIQYKVNNTWVLKSDYSENGYTSIKQGETDSGHIYYDRKFTQEGRAFVLEVVNQLDKKEVAI